MNSFTDLMSSSFFHQSVYHGSWRTKSYLWHELFIEVQQYNFPLGEALDYHHFTTISGVSGATIVHFF